MATGPVQHDPTITKRGDDGRWVHTFRQSWLNTYMDCPERARHEEAGTIERIENDAACVGTAFHAAVEDAIALRADDVLLGGDDLVDLWDAHWADLEDQHEIAFVKRSRKGAIQYGHRVASRFADHVLEWLDPFATEVAFGPIVLHEDDERVIQLTGTIDYIDRTLGMVDWKTASRAYEAWEKQRWAIQPTVYAEGLATLHAQGLVSPFHGDTYGGPLSDWHYCVFPDRAQSAPQWVRVQRPTQWNPWLVEQLLPIARQLESQTAPWVARDQHALCSPKWCPLWATCKGKHLGVDDMTTVRVELPWVA